MSEIAIFAAATLTVVLVSSAFGKLRAPARFGDALASYGVIPTSVFPILVVLVPGAELGLAGAQWFRVLQPAAGYALTAVLAAFTLLLLGSLIRGVDADCGCFGGSAPEKISWFSVVRNLVLIALALVGATTAGSSGGGALPAALTGVGAGLLILVLGQGLALRARRGLTAARR